MNEKEIYSVYVSIKNIHKKYAAHVRDMAYLPELIADINQLNSSHNSNFCNAMTEVLRQWFIGRFPGVEPEKLADAYRELWFLHKKYIGTQHDDAFWQAVTADIEKLNRDYGGCRQLQLYALAIEDELEMKDIKQH